MPGAVSQPTGGLGTRPGANYYGVTYLAAGLTVQPSYACPDVWVDGLVAGY